MRCGSDVLVDLTDYCHRKLSMLLSGCVQAVRRKTMHPRSLLHSAFAQSDDDDAKDAEDDPDVR
jgi:hypothetical protein